METPNVLGIIAGSGVYPKLLAQAAREAGIRSITAAAFEGETEPALASLVDTIEWMRVGQLSRLLKTFRDAGVSQAIMAGQIAPQNLFDLRPDWKALLMLARLRRRNAESIFGAIADELLSAGVTLLPATTFLERFLAPEGLIAGNKLRRREEADMEFGFEIAREIGRLDIGQTVIIKNATVLAVEAFEGTNEAIKRGGRLGRKGTVMVKVAKPDPDMRFDVPVIGAETIRIAAEAGVAVIAIEAGKTLLLEKEQIVAHANRLGVSVIGR